MNAGFPPVTLLALRREFPSLIDRVAKRGVGLGNLLGSGPLLHPLFSPKKEKKRKKTNGRDIPPPQRERETLSFSHA